MCGNSDLVEPPGHSQACRDWLYHWNLRHGARGHPWLGRSLGVRTLLVLGEAGLRDMCGTDGLPKRWTPHTEQGRL